MAKKLPVVNSELNTVRGVSRLTIQAVKSITDLVEEMHGAISHLSPPVKSKTTQPKKTRGVTGVVYRSVRGITGVVGWSIERSLDVAQIPVVSAALSKALAPSARQLTSKLKLKVAEPYRESVLAAVNGVLGDTLAASNNPLAIAMQFRQRGQPVQAPIRNGKLLILVHGLCMNDVQWLRENHDHGKILGEAFGYEPIYLHYNTGRRIAENGTDFACLLEQTFAQWPVPITELVIIGHSMGGLVARSACHTALQSKHTWLKHLSKLITLGTPHAGAPLERAGRGVDYILGVSPYTAPFARIGLARSAGIQDLRDGAVAASGEVPAWPKHVKLYTLACTKQKAPASEPKTLTAPLKRLLGDGLVPVKSALAQEDKPALGLPLRVPASRYAVVYETDHFEMLASAQVAKHLQQWLSK